MSLKIAFVHYHLRAGGVTRVIENAVRGLASQDARVVSVVGEAPDHESNHPCAVVDGLMYLSRSEKPICDAKTLAARMLEAAKGAFEGEEPDVWHVHNHSLGKNYVLPGALLRLARGGQRMLLQIHDFAEDGRPRCYLDLRASADERSFQKTAYPIGDHLHYAALNSRDLNCLARAGVPGDQLHLLANPVATHEPPPLTGDTTPTAMEDVSGLTLYPARGIRRKNLGEFVLWSTLAESDSLYAMTLPPTNPAERPFHDRWVNYVKRSGLRALFAASSRAPFEAWVAKAERCISTSVAEGFGLAFLEPYLVGKPLIGRNLPGITEDFVEEGVDLTALYKRLVVPVKLVDRAALWRRVEEQLTTSFHSYRTEIPKDAAREAIMAHSEDGHIDFGFLDEDLQEEVIDKVRKSTSLRDEIFGSVDQLGASPETISRNREVISSAYCLHRYGERLVQIYGALAEASVSSIEGLDADEILQSFLSPKDFKLLRT